MLIAPQTCQYQDWATCTKQQSYAFPATTFMGSCLPHPLWSKSIVQDLDTALSMPILINFFLWDLRLIRKGEERNLGSKALCTGRLRLAREFCWMRVRLRKSEENLDKGRDTIVFACHNDFLFIFYKLLSLLNLTG